MKSTVVTDRPPGSPTLNEEDRAAFLRSHLRWGWWSLAVFLSLGLALEALHGFKVGWYLNVSAQTRRLLFTLAHAHGTLLSLIHLAFGFTLSQLPDWTRGRAAASAALKAATLLLPGGFFLGGLIIHQGDPGLGVLLVPVGALLLLLSAVLCARALAPANLRSREVPKPK